MPFDLHLMKTNKADTVTSNRLFPSPLLRPSSSDAPAWRAGNSAAPCMVNQCEIKTNNATHKIEPIYGSDYTY